MANAVFGNSTSTVDAPISEAVLPKVLPSTGALSIRDRSVAHTDAFLLWAPFFPLFPDFIHRIVGKRWWNSQFHQFIGECGSVDLFR